jgi:hypothetical protein
MEIVRFVQEISTREAASLAGQDRLEFLGYTAGSPCGAGSRCSEPPKEFLSLFA